MLSVKKATLKDLNAVVPLFDAYRIFYGKQQNKADSSAFLKARLENKESVIFLGSWEDKPIAFTQLYPLFSSTRLQRLWMLNDLFVATAYRQKGMAQALIDAAKQLAQTTQAAGLLLETEKNNLPGNLLYPKMDFIRDEAHHFYFWETTPST